MLVSDSIFQPLAKTETLTQKVCSFSNFVCSFIGHFFISVVENICFTPVKYTYIFIIIVYFAISNDIRTDNNLITLSGARPAQATLFLGPNFYSLFIRSSANNKSEVVVILYHRFR